MKNKRYLVIILILSAFLRLNSFWVLIFGVLSVVLVWYLAGQLFPKQKWTKEACALFLAVSPWHISLAGYAFQASLAILIAVLGTSLLIKIFQGKWLYLSMGVLILVSSQIVSPFAINFTNAKDVVWLTDQQRREHGEFYDSFTVKAFHNKAINYSLSFLEHLGEHFSGDFLFISGKMYLFDILFLMIGFFALIKKNEWDKRGVILLWLGLAPVNSAFSFAPPDPFKAALMIIPLVIISSYGAVVLFERVQSFLEGCTIKR